MPQLAVVPRARRQPARLGVAAAAVLVVPDATGLISGRGRTRWMAVRAASAAFTDAHALAVPVGTDGETLVLPPPVRCDMRPASPRVGVPQQRPGLRPALPEVDWAACGAWPCRSAVPVRRP